LDACQWLFADFYSSFKSPAAIYSRGAGGQGIVFPVHSVAFRSVSFMAEVPAPGASYAQGEKEGDIQRSRQRDVECPR
jgi:hypothetical protein